MKSLLLDFPLFRPATERVNRKTPLVRRERGNTRKGNVLLLSVILMSFTVFVFVSLATLSSQLLKSISEKASRQVRGLGDSCVEQALGPAFYQQYWAQRINAPGTLFDTPQAIAAIQATPIIIGPTATNVVNTATGVTFTLPGNLDVAIDLGSVLSGFVPFTPGQGPFSIIDNAVVYGWPQSTGSWLGSLYGRVHPLPVTITYRMSEALGLSNEFIGGSPRTILFCEIPQKQLALLAEQDFTAAPIGTPNIQGTARVVGQVAVGSGAIDIQGSMLYGNANNATSTTVTQNGGNAITGTGGTATTAAADFRFQTEIQGYAANGNSNNNSLRSTSNQGILDPVRIIPTADMCREGRGQYLGADPNKQALYYAAQPFYSAVTSPSVYAVRLWGSCNGTTAAYNLVNVSADPRDTCYTGPLGALSWVSISVVPNPLGGTLTQIEVDLGDPNLMALANGRALKVFVGGFNGAAGDPPDISTCIVALRGAPQIQTPQKPLIGPYLSPTSVTVISPNHVIFEGAFNYDPTVGYSPLPASIIANTVGFGITPLAADVNYTGSVRGGNAINQVFQAEAFDGTSSGNPRDQINVRNLDAVFGPTQAAEAATLSASEMLFIALVSQPN